MNWDYELIITITSAVIALASALLAWQAVRTAEKTYSVELLSQLYTTYQSKEMTRDLQIVWALYHQLWAKDAPTQPEAEDQTNQGVPIQATSAQAFFQQLDNRSPEYQAIHNMINFWTYVALLEKRKALKVEEIRAFTSPRILGFLYPIEKAYFARHGVRWDERSSLLKHMYEVMDKANKD